MKLYKYSKFEKLNQALDSFKRNGILVIKVEIIPIAKNEVAYFVLTDPKHKSKPQKKTLKLKPSKSPKDIIEKGKPSPSSRKKKKKPKK